jgi:hypothetical protein
MATKTRKKLSARQTRLGIQLEQAARDILAYASLSLRANQLLPLHHEPSHQAA